MTETPDRFRKRPVEIEARQWDGTADGATRIIDWILGHGSTASYICSNPDRCQENDGDTPHSISIHTLEGTMRADLDDWVIREPFPTGDRQFYPCKPDIFAKTYEPAAVVAAGPAPATDQDDLRDRIAEGLLDHLSRTADIRPSKAGPLAFMPEVTDEERMRLADAVLSVLPASIDQAAVRAEAFREAAVAVRRGAFADTFDRMADETPQPETSGEDSEARAALTRVRTIAERAAYNVQRPAARLARRILAELPAQDAWPPRCPCHPAAPAVVAQPDEEASDPEVVAYRSPQGRSLYCLRHVGELFGAVFTPVTAEDLPDGGICTYPDCGADVLITQQPDEEAEPRQSCACGQDGCEYCDVDEEPSS